MENPKITHFIKFLTLFYKAGISREKAIELFFKERNEAFYIVETYTGEPNARTFVVSNGHYEPVAIIYQPPIIDPSPADCIICPLVDLSTAQRGYILKRLEPLYV